MNQSISEHTQGSVKDYFAIDSHIASTRSADAYSALDVSRQSHICLWLLRHPLAVNSEAVRRFLKRMRILDSIEPRVSDMVGYGVDRDGSAFAVFNPLDGQPIHGGQRESYDAERRFTGCVGIISRIHQAGVVCGDLCGASFWLDRAGDVRFLGVMGSFDSEATATAMLPPMETLHYMAPEQRSGAGLESATDVFALGVLGYYLLTGKFPFGDKPTVFMAGGALPEMVLPSTLISSPPVWADTVLLKCLSFNPAERYANASELAQAIREIRERTSDKESMPTRRESRKVEKASLEEHQMLEVRDDLAPALTDAPAKKGRPFKLIAAAFASGLLVVLGYGYYVSEFKSVSVNPLKNSLALHRMITGEELGRAIDSLGKEGANAQEQGRNIDLIANSDDPVAHDVLVTAAKGSSESLRRVAERALIERARRLGMTRSSEEVRIWLTTLQPGASLPAYYEPILKSLDSTLPIEAKDGVLRQAYAGNPQFVVRLASALALDAKSIADYQPIMAQLLGDTLHLDDATKHSALALILASPDLTAAYGDDVIQRRDELPDSDVLWGMRALSARADSRVRALANLAYERGLVSPARKVFLGLLRDRSDLPTDASEALVRAASGTLRVEDIASIGRWYDIAVERILYAICADEQDLDILLEAFDTVASRSLSIEPGASLIEWVRNNYWNNRTDFIQAIGVLSSLDVADTAMIESAFAVFDRYAKDKRLISILLDAENPVISRVVIDKYRGLIGVGKLLGLLSNSDPEVRYAAVVSLKDFNDIGALRIIIESYEHEKDPKVRKAYEENLWVIKQRIEGATPVAQSDAQVRGSN